MNAGVLSAGLTAVPLKLGRLSFLLGAAVNHTDTEVMQSYGFRGLVGTKLALSHSIALRVDGIQSYMNKGNHTNMGVQMGLSLFRNPRGITRTVTRTDTLVRTEIRTVAATPVPQRPDSVSAAETQRLRALAVSYQALRDSLARPGVTPFLPASSAAALATMQQLIYFQHDRSEISDSAKLILRDKVAVFKANPAMRIVIVGFASQPGTDAYNMALGLRRGEQAKAYLVSQGVDAIRIEIATRGEGQLVVEGPGELADAANRRGQFRLLIADPNPPKK